MSVVGHLASGKNVVASEELRDRLVRDSIRAVHPGMRSRQFYGSMDAYDPVLRFHCRLEEEKKEEE